MLIINLKLIARYIWSRLEDSCKNLPFDRPEYKKYSLNIKVNAHNSIQFWCLISRSALTVQFFSSFIVIRPNDTAIKHNSNESIAYLVRIWGNKLLACCCVLQISINQASSSSYNSNRKRRKMAILLYDSFEEKKTTKVLLKMTIPVYFCQKDTTDVK